MQNFHSVLGPARKYKQVSSEGIRFQVVAYQRLQTVKAPRTLAGGGSPSQHVQHGPQGRAVNPETNAQPLAGGQHQFQYWLRRALLPAYALFHYEPWILPLRHLWGRVPPLNAGVGRAGTGRSISPRVTAKR